MIIKCENGHWYDGNVDQTCPHCKRNGEKLELRVDDVKEDDRTVSAMDVDLDMDAAIGNFMNQPLQLAEDMFGEVTVNSSGDDDKTVSFGFFGIVDVPPVTGWLVCLTGSEFGRDFRLHADKNFIGRSPSMDVVLVDDKTVARDKHCSVAYDPKGNRFYVSPENSNLVYLNDNLIHTPVEIKEGDKITIGKTVLELIPYCKEGRTW